ENLTVGQWMWTPSSMAYAASSQFQASSCTTDDWPDTSPPCGVIWASRIPLDRSVLITLESVLYAINERTWALFSPTSASSTVARTASISTSPRFVLGAMKPGYTCLPAASTTSAPAGVSVALPT